LVGPEADVASLAEVAEGLDPAEDFLGALTDALAMGVADVPGAIARIVGRRLVVHVLQTATSNPGQTAVIRSMACRC
jgi:hypothetical protein